MSLPAVIRKRSLRLVEAELVAAYGNVFVAARRLGVPARELREAIVRIPYLVDAVLEGVERRLDAAEAIIVEGMTAPELETRLKTARFTLACSPAAKRRGWRRPHSIDVPTGRPPYRPLKAER